MPEVAMPRLSDTMTEGTISSWLLHEGDTVRRGDILAEIETDKATMELEAYDAGVLTAILVAEGATVPIGTPIAVIGGSGAEPAMAVTASATVPAAEPAAAATEPASGEPAHLRATPLVRALAREHGIDLRTVTGTGPGGRIVRADIDALLVEPAAAPADSSGVLVSTREAPGAGLDGDERIPLTSIRRITAARLTESAAAPHFHLTAVADVGALLGLRADLNAQLPADPAGPALKISVTDLLIRAAALTLPGHLDVNSSWGGDHLVRHHRINIGCAVAADAGLLVPVLPDADRLSLVQTATLAHRLINRVRAGRISPDELAGGTFTISNLGGFGMESFTAVINPPQAAILAVGAVTERVVLRAGQPTAVDIVKLTLTVDHRVLDGAAAAAFLRDLVAVLEHPLRLLL